MMRVAALSTYENQPISTGVLLLATDEDPVGHYPAAERDEVHYTGALTSIKSFYRLADGLRTVFLVNRSGRLLDIVDIARWADDAGPGRDVDVPCAQTYTGHARATLAGAARLRRAQPAARDQGLRRRGAGVQLQPRRLAAVRPDRRSTRLWQSAVGSDALAERLFRSALDLSDARQGALFVVLRRPVRIAGPAGGGHRPPRHGAARAGPARRGRRRAATCCTCWPGAR